MASPEAQRPRFAYVSPDRLRFDPSNPRFGGLSGNPTQDSIQTILEREPHYAHELVDSFLENGFIDYEPLVVRRDGENFVVVEGNRRLAAIRHILAHRNQYQEKSSRLDDLSNIPVLVFPEIAGAQEEKEQRVYLGVRHLFGFREWPAESKARFLDGNIRKKEDLARILRELNIKKNEVGRYLVPYRLRKAAKTIWDPYRNQDFWVLGESLNRSGIKEYVELEVDRDSLTVESFNEKKLKNLLEFIYGTPDGGKLAGRRIRETRDISTLAKILASKRAATVLEKGHSLDEAALFIESRQESLARLGRLVRELKLLLKGVLGIKAQDSDAKAALAHFKEFEENIKRFIQNAK